MSRLICHNKDGLYIFKIFLKSFIPDMRQSKTLLLLTNVDQKSLETGFSISICRPIFRLPCVARLATNGNQNTVSIAISVCIKQREFVTCYIFVL